MFSFRSGFKAPWLDRPQSLPISVMRALALIAVLGCLAGACSPPNKLFDRQPFPPVQSLTCNLKTVHSGVLNPGYSRGGSRDPLTLSIGDLNAGSRTARIGGNNDTVPVEFRAAPSQMQFIETTPTGNLTVLTVFSPPERGAPLPAVYSRHIEISPANVSISQFAGECVVA